MWPIELEKTLRLRIRGSSPTEITAGFAEVKFEIFWENFSVFTHTADACELMGKLILTILSKPPCQKKKIINISKNQIKVL